MVKRSLQQTLDQVRRNAARGRPVPDDDVILAGALEQAARAHRGMGEVINATGVVLHTGLGRAPLPRAATGAAVRAARSYADLEVDLATGGRGRRTARAEALLQALTGAEDALVVNNNAAALLLALSSLASRKEVLVSRGELIEIGGEFRLPDIMRASGARLVEVGTTNRTRASDYRKALGPRTGLILKVHPSNYRVVGFAHAVAVGDLAALAVEAAVPLLFDVGSGLMDRYPEIPIDEPAVSEALAAGADLVSFSGDKLLGGPQAGLVVGRPDLIGRMRRHPVARAVRVDKMTVAALEAVLRMYAEDRRTELPVWRTLAISPTALLRRARALATGFDGAAAAPSEAAAGGGSLPALSLPSAEVVVPVSHPEAVAARLRTGRPPVFCRVGSDAVAFDLRTVSPDDDERLARAIRHALERG